MPESRLTLSLEEAIKKGFRIHGDRGAKYVNSFKNAPLSIINIHAGWDDLVYWNGEYWVYLSTIKSV